MQWIQQVDTLGMHCRLRAGTDNSLAGLSRWIWARSIPIGVYTLEYTYRSIYVVYVSLWPIVATIVVARGTWLSALLLIDKLARTCWYCCAVFGRQLLQRSAQKAFLLVALDSDQAACPDSHDDRASHKLSRGLRSE